MSSTALSVPQRRSLLVSRTRDYVELIKPKISVLVLATVAVSYYVSSLGFGKLWVLLHALIGTTLVAGSASALNQWLERRSDGLMRRTAQRPLPAGRLGTAEVLVFAMIAILAGLVYLAVAVNFVTALFGLATWVVYVWIYTPLKARTSSNTAVGAVAGALPVFIGSAAAGNLLDLKAATIFLIVYLWQFPHFMAIAWLYRHEYARGGMKMLSVVDPSGRRAGVQAVLAALVLLPVSLVPAWSATYSGASLYATAVFLLGVGQLICAIVFFARLDQTASRWLLRASLIYLPAILVLLILIC